MNKIRLFMAVFLSEEIKAQIYGLEERLKKILKYKKDLRFSPEENWHFTLSFLGYQNEEDLPLIKQGIEGAVKKIKEEGGFSRTVKFNKLDYGPPDTERRMIWLYGDETTSVNFGKIKAILEDELKNNGVKWQGEGFSNFNAHITLARFLPTPLKDLPDISGKVSWEYDFREIKLMQSHLTPAGADYEEIFSVDF